MKLKKCCGCGNTIKIDGYDGPVEPHVLWQQPNGRLLVQCWDCWEKDRTGQIAKDAIIRNMAEHHKAKFRTDTPKTKRERSDFFIVL